MRIPLAHELWFEHEQFPMDWSFAGQQATLGLLAGAVLFTLAVRVIAHWWPGVDVPVLARMAPFIRSRSACTSRSR